MRLNAREIEDWGRALKFPLIVGAIGFVLWRIFRKKEDYSYNNLNTGIIPSLVPGYNGGASGSPWGGTPYDDNQIKSDAESLLNAFDYTWGTDLETLNEIRLRYVGRPRDFARLWNAFGKPKYGYTGTALFNGTPKNLKEWIKEELSKTEQQAWNDLFVLIGK